MPFYWCHKNLIIFAEFFQPMCWWNFMYIDFLVLYGWILKRTNDTGIHPLLPIFSRNAFYIWNICISWISLHICPSGVIRPDDKCKHFTDKGYFSFGEYLSHYPYRQWLMIPDAHVIIIIVVVNTILCICFNAYVHTYIYLCLFFHAYVQINICLCSCFHAIATHTFPYAYSFMHMSTHIFLSIWISLSMPHINNPIVITVNRTMLH